MQAQSVVLLAALFSGSAAWGAEYVFSSPPRESMQKEMEIYQPIAEFLSRATGETITYEYPGNWLTYQTKMLKNQYDVLFDGPHFVGWRITKKEHIPLAKLPQPQTWIVITKAGHPRAKRLSELAGQKVCVHAPPNFGTLTLLSLFTNPARQPYMAEIKGWKAGFQGVMDGKCSATILPLTNWKEFDPDGTMSTVLHRHQPYPNQAFTAGPRVPTALKNKMITALLSPAGQQAMSKLREQFAGGKELVPADKDEYRDVALVLQNVWGFEFETSTAKNQSR
ncbi:MAG TPA: PhnD/SsuA/transferrin family substrate-binding protein [Acidiferrobacterales bacterium]